MAPSYYDDNFGEWDIQDEDDLEFYRQVQARLRMLQLLR